MKKTQKSHTRTTNTSKKTIHSHEMCETYTVDIVRSSMWLVKYENSHIYLRIHTLAHRNTQSCVFVCLLRSLANNYFSFLACLFTHSFTYILFSLVSLSRSHLFLSIGIRIVLKKTLLSFLYISLFFCISFVLTINVTNTRRHTLKYNWNQRTKKHTHRSPHSVADTNTYEMKTSHFVVDKHCNWVLLKRTNIIDMGCDASFIFRISKIIKFNQSSSLNDFIRIDWLQPKKQGFKSNICHLLRDTHLAHLLHCRRLNLYGALITN